MTASPPRPSRRALVHGAAWAVPTALVSFSAPAFAASCDPIAQTRRLVAPTSNTVGSGPLAREEWTVPAGVTEVTFEVLGGGGGDADDPTRGANLQNRGGHGALVTGTLAVTPGQVLTLIAGNGGIGQEDFGTSNNIGGKGFGNGGDTLDPGGAGSKSAGSGGGGSAILLGTTPLVVAGGGGGGSGLVFNSTRGYTVSGYGGGNGGDAALNGTNGVNQALTGNFSAGLAEGGGGATGATPGQPRGTNVVTGNATNGNERIIGQAGSAPGASGGNGGTGVLSRAYNGRVNTWQTSSAGGGGGYAGGASGTTHARNYVVTGGDLTYSIGGPGGGGSSFVSPTAVTSSQVASGNNGATTILVRNPGRVVITYEACPEAA